MRLLLLVVLMAAWPAFAQSYTFITTSGNPITLSLDCSPTSGTAPMGVFCSAVGTTATGVTSPYHELEYRWDFGDAVVGASGTCGAVVAGQGFYACGARAAVSSKNLATGPVAGHVFESAGTKTITLTVTDGTNTNVTTRNIIVAAADTTYASTLTTCVRQAATGDFTGCPSGADQVTQATFATVLSTYATDGRRVLLRAGDTWAGGNGVLAPSGSTGGMIGMFGSGAKPIISVTSGSQNGLSISSCARTSFANWSISDLVFTGYSLAATGVTFEGSAANITLLRVEVSDFNQGLTLLSSKLDTCEKTVPGQTLWDRIFVHDSNFTGGITNTVIGNQTRYSFQGNKVGIDRSGTPFALRTGYFDKAVFSNNNFTNTNLGVTLRAPLFTGEGIIPASTYSQYAVFSDNYLAGGANADSGQYLIWTRPTNNTLDERIRYVIVERNWFQAVANVKGCSAVAAVSVTERNNLCDLAGSGTVPVGFNVGRLGVEPAPTGINFYNNTVVTDSVVASPVCFNVDSSTLTDSPNNIKNNICYTPNATGSPVVVSDPGSDATASNNSATATTNPNLTTFPPTTADCAGTMAWRPTSGFPIDGGTAVPVWSDFCRATRTGTYDVGGLIP